MSQRLVLLLGLSCLVLSGASPAAGQALAFDDLDWTLEGLPSGPSSVTAELMHVEGPDGPCTGQAAFVTSAPFDGVVRVQLNFVNLDVACHYDWPLYLVNGVATKIYFDLGQTDCWFAQPFDVAFEVAAGDSFGLGVGSADCFKGPGIADFRSFSLVPHEPWTDLGRGLDPRLLARLTPAAALAAFGDRLLAVGDVDGDGIDDLAVASESPAQLALHSGADGAQLWSRPVATFGPGDHLGLAAPGDLDGDGLPDLAVGSPQASSVQALSGADGQALWSWEGGTFAAFGAHLAAHADLDDDGVLDLAVGSEALGSSFVPVLSGASGAVLPAYLDSPGDSTFGTRLAAAGDLDGDGLGDLALTVEVAGVPRVRVLSGGDGATLFELVSPAGAFAPDSFGQALALTSDLTGDGVAELVVGSPDAVGPPGLGLPGAVLIYSGADGSLVRSIPGLRDGGRFGAAVAAGGDLDGDGLDELCVGQPEHGEPFGPILGRVAVLSGADDQVLQSFVGRPGDGFGSQLAWLGGTADPRLAVGAPDHGAGGAVHLVRALDHPSGQAPDAQAYGEPALGNVLRLAVEGGLPGGAAVLVLGATGLYAPFKGGTLVPSPDVLVSLPLDADGALRVEAPWPIPGQPVEPIRTQVWWPDPDGPAGFAASNGLRSP